MKRILLAGALAVLGSLMVVSVASAAVGDIDGLNIDGSLEITTEESPSAGEQQGVVVEGTIACNNGRSNQPTTMEYGLWTKVVQGNEGLTSEPNSQDGNDNGSEAVGAFGPDFAPPAGMSDDQPCRPDGTRFDVVTFRNFGSAPFQEGQAEALVAAGTSAESGARAPGPFIGDLEHVVECVFLEDDEGNDSDGTEQGTCNLSPSNRVTAG